MNLKNNLECNKRNYIKLFGYKNQTHKYNSAGSEKYEKTQNYDI